MDYEAPPSKKDRLGRFTNVNHRSSLIVAHSVKIKREQTYINLAYMHFLQ